LLPHLAFQNNRVPIKQMFFGPLNRFFNTDPLVLKRGGFQTFQKLAQGSALVVSQLCVPQSPQFIPAQILLLPSSLRRCQLLA